MPGKYYRLFKKEGLGSRSSNDGILRETFSLTELEESGVTEKELVVNRMADCGCLLSNNEIAMC